MRRAEHWAWGGAGVGLALALVGMWWSWLARGLEVPAIIDPVRPSFFLGWLVFAVLGAVVASRRPENAVGWVLLVAGLAWVLHGLTGAYRLPALAGPDPWPGGHWAAWAWDWSWAPAVALIFLLPVLFLTGRLLTARWWVVPVSLAGGCVLMAAAAATAPGPLPSTPTVTNPLGGALPARLGGPAEVLGSLLFAGGSLGALTAPFVRYRRAGGEERQQLKWFAFAGFAVLLAWLTAGALEAAGASPALLGDLRVAPLLLLPAAIVVALLRYRLYDIDRLISRTLGWIATTGAVGGAYAAVVVALPTLLPLPLDSALAVALATLLAAAAIGPVHRRVQRMVDRRFYRARYDARRVADGFASRLRDQVDLDALRQELADVVTRVVQPAHTSLWLPEPRGEDPPSRRAGT